MAREQSRINPDFIESQTQKRNIQEQNLGNENSINSLKARVLNLEELLAVKSYSVV